MTGYSADEMMTVSAARALRDGAVCFVGIGLPSTAANLARATHAPRLVLIYESGTIGAKPDRLPLSIGDGVLADHAGAVGAPEIAASCREVIVVVRQSPRVFVSRVDFITSLGYGDGPGHRERLGLTGAGPRMVITDLGILEPDPQTCELTLTHLHPGVDAETVRANTGWPLREAAEVRRTAAPTETELAVLRRLEATKGLP